MSNLELETVAAQLEGFVRRQFAVDDDDDLFDRQVNLAEEGYVDSVGLVECIVFLEETFGIVVPEKALFSLESFHIDGLVQLVLEIDGVAPVKPPHFERDPELGPVCELIRSTWARPCWSYTEALLGAYLRRPTGDPTLSVALVDGDDIAAYQAAVPYRIAIGEKHHDVVQGAFWTANPAFAGQGAGRAILHEVLRLSRERGAVAFCAVMEKNSQAARLLETTESAAGLSLAKVFRQHVTTPARLRRGADGPPAVRYQAEHRDGCAALFAGLSTCADVAKYVPEEDVQFVLEERPETATWVYLDGDTPRAFVNVLRSDMLLDSGSKATGLLETIATGDLGDEERLEFLRAVFRDSFWSDIDVVSAPAMGYADDVLKSLGFVPAPTQFHLYWLPLDESAAIGSIGSCYLDLL